MVEKEMTLLQEQIEHILKTDIRARNCDKWLIYKVLSEFYTKIYIPFDDFKNLPSFESITRSRRKIQNDDNKFMPTDPVVIGQRSKRCEKFKEWAVNNNEV